MLRKGYGGLYKAPQHRYKAPQHINFDCMFDFILFQRTVLERLDAGETVIGDGGMIFNLERRGYVHAGNFTPEVVIEHPDAGK